MARIEYITFYMMLELSVYDTIDLSPGNLHQCAKETQGLIYWKC